METNFWDIASVIGIIAVAGGYLVWRYTRKKPSGGGCGCGCSGCDSSNGLPMDKGGCGGCGGC